MIFALGMNLSVSAVCYMLPSDFNWNYNGSTGGKPLRGPGDAAHGIVTPIWARKSAGTGAVNPWCRVRARWLQCCSAAHALQTSSTPVSQDSFLEVFQLQQFGLMSYNCNSSDGILCSNTVKTVAIWLRNWRKWRNEFQFVDWNCNKAYII